MNTSTQMVASRMKTHLQDESGQRGREEEALWWAGPLEPQLGSRELPFLKANSQMGRVSIWEDGPVLEKCGGDGGSTLGMNLMPLSRTVKNSKFYAHILPQILKWQKKKVRKLGTPESMVL